MWYDAPARRWSHAPGDDSPRLPLRFLGRSVAGCRLLRSPRPVTAMSLRTRREHLHDVGRSMFLATFGGSLVADLGSGDAWPGDRHFATAGFMAALVDRRATFVLRRHAGRTGRKRPRSARR